MEPLIDTVDVSRRVRAAVEYANVDESEAVKRTGISASTWRRIVRKTNPRGFKKREELEQVAAGLGVPEDFLLYGFGDSVPGSENGETLREQLARHEELIRQLAAAALPTAGAGSDPTPGQESEPHGRTGDT